jgi:hypothetical protein
MVELPRNAKRGGQVKLRRHDDVHAGQGADLLDGLYGATGLASAAGKLCLRGSNVGDQITHPIQPGMAARTPPTVLIDMRGEPDRSSLGKNCAKCSHIGTFNSSINAAQCSMRCTPPDFARYHNVLRRVSIVGDPGPQAAGQKPG